MTFVDFSKSYTFSKFFELNIESDDLVADFGYSFARKWLNLPQSQQPLARIEELRSRISEILPFVNLSTEMARREILISRVLTELVYYTKAQLRIEYPLKVSEQLQGTLDYLLLANKQLLVIEAKKEDLVKGMTQLAVELITLDHWLDDPNDDNSNLLGAVTTGTLWQFAQLNRHSKHISQGLESFRVPEDLDPLLRILVYALKGSNSTNTT
ncbi:MAG: hypothetical protein GDA44_00750 [Prochloron sp. SP5CPC1]|nr:hypothetical protein [Candidatus Paraprochloron terpiosi SP5CPC1]